MVRGGLGLILVLTVSLSGAVLLGWQPWSRVPEAPYDTLLAETDATPVDAVLEGRIEAFCGDCHAFPQPSSFPRYAWHTEVRMGYEYYAKSGRVDLDPPPIHATVAYYRSRAPKELTFPRPTDTDGRWSGAFRVQKILPPPTLTAAPAVAHLKWTQLTPDGPFELLVCDMRSGTITALPLGPGAQPARELARLRHPCHVELCDLDGDGHLDLIVADLGSFPPGDHDRGRVVWLRRMPDDEAYEPIVLAEGLGRVADARPGDFDSDGDLDLIVADFGMDRSGQVVLLRNVAEPGELPRFEQERLDPRPGAIHVPPYDLDGDGHLDFVVLLSQEYEQVIAFINQSGSPQPTRPFYPQLLWEGPDLTFGASGLSLIDLNGDGLVDILFTNGDAFDNGFVNPGHGVQWLENRGQLKFDYHRLADLTGAYAAAAGDLDLDGDLDIVCVAWMPGDVEPANVLDHPRASVICLEQIAPGQFVRHTLEWDLPVHACLELADLDGDGDLDFVVGYHTLARPRGDVRWIDIWWNQQSF